VEDSGRHAPYAARMADRPTTRLAPTPSGALHVGNARTFLVNWALARNLGWRIVLRLEDLDLGRVKDGAHAAAIEDMRWIGVDWDGEPEIQSRDLAPYREALSRLTDAGRTFRCDRSRAEIRSAASAPHAEDGETRYPPELRPPEPWFREIEAWGADAWQANHRLRVDLAPERVRDEFLGERVFDPGLEAGDLVVWTKLGVPAYQLAVVVDDARHGVTDVVRGDDLLASAARQQLIARALGLPHARWWHVPLVYGEDGKRLAKRHGSHSLAAMRAGDRLVRAEPRALRAPRAFRARVPRARNARRTPRCRRPRPRAADRLPRRRRLIRRELDSAGASPYASPMMRALAVRALLLACVSAVVLAVPAMLVGCDGGAAPTTTKVVAGGKEFTVKLAMDNASREKGLGGVTSLGPDEVVDCLMDIDIAYIDPFGFVTAVHTMPKEPPQAEGESRFDYEKRLRRYPSGAPAQFALEVAPGTLAGLGVRRGTRVEFDRDTLKKLAD